MWYVILIAIILILLFIKVDYKKSRIIDDECETITTLKINEKELSPYYIIVNYDGWINIFCKCRTIQGVEKRLNEIGCNYTETLTNVYKAEKLEEVLDEYSNFYIGKVDDEHSKETGVGDVYIAEILSWDYIDDL